MQRKKKMMIHDSVRFFKKLEQTKQNLFASIFLHLLFPPVLNIRRAIVVRAVKFEESKVRNFNLKRMTNKKQLLMLFCFPFYSSSQMSSTTLSKRKLHMMYLSVSPNIIMFLMTKRADQFKADGQARSCWL